MDTNDVLTSGITGGVVAVLSHFYNKFMADRRAEDVDNKFIKHADKIAEAIERVANFEIYAAREYITNSDLRNTMDSVQRSLDMIDGKLDRLDNKLDTKADK